MLNTLLRHINRRAELLTALGVIGFIGLAVMLEKQGWVFAAILVLVGLLFLYWAGFAKRWVTWVFYFCIPLSLHTGLGGGFDMSVPTEPIMLLLAVIFLFSVALKGKLSLKFLSHPVSLLLFAEVLIFTVTSFTSSMPEVSFKRTLSRALYIVVFYVFTGHIFSELRQVPRYFTAYASGLFFVILFTLIAHARYGFDPKVSFIICQPYYPDHTVYGACIAFLIPILLLLVRNAETFGLPVLARTLITPLLVFLLVGEFFSYSRAAWLSLMLAWIFAQAMRLRIRIVHIIVFLGLLGGIVFLSWDKIYMKMQQTDAISNTGGAVEQLQSVSNLKDDASNLERVNRWTCALRMFSSRPLIGFGPGTYQFQYGQFQSPYEMTYISTRHGDRGNAHSEYLTYFAETGIVGAINNLLLVFTALALGLRIVYRTKDQKVRLLATGLLMGLVTFYIHGLFNMFIDQDKMAGLVYTALAGLVAIDLFHRDASPEKETLSLPA